MIQFQKIQQLKEMNSSQNQSQQPACITLEFYSSQTQSTNKISYPISILDFNIELLHTNHNQPYPIPKQITTSEYPFQIIKQFLQSHQYNPKNYHLVKPINSKNYKDLVDPNTFKVCQKFSQKEFSQKASQIVNLCRFMRFHQLHDAICAAIATNYYIEPNNQKQLSQFKRVNKIDDLSSQEICQIIKQYEDVFNMIQVKAKEDFLKRQKQGAPIQNKIQGN